jgi:hypothetical protein
MLIMKYTTNWIENKEFYLIIFMKKLSQYYNYEVSDILYSKLNVMNSI